MYKAKIKKGEARFSNMKGFMWAEATQEELKKAYELGHTKNIEFEEDAKPKKTKSKAKKVKDSEISDNEQL
jgi:hypothetical protein|tara:strand:+ start:17614 stop:17826 length:213 start_codon:yes stop_codon:yes gene_type:complete